MSEANVPPRPMSTDEDALDMLARADQTPIPSPPSEVRDDGWETVPLPGMFSGETSAQGEAPGSPMASTPGSREAELLGLIEDLNRCNEALLSRVNQLESALEASQRALQQAVERSRQSTEEEKVAAAQKQSVAQLLSELERADAEIKRQSILSETLQAQLDTYQERSQHLERECARLQKRHAEKTQHLHQVEEACRDLRSRLQRQQRYTLQFKAALEKCLDTAAFKQTATEIQSDTDLDTPPLWGASPSLSPAAMPRAERIQPWSATDAVTPADSHLLSLVRSQPHPAPTPPTGVPVPPIQVDPTPSASPETVDSEAEKQLWQDVERVIENASPAASSQASSPPQQEDAAAEVQFTEPLPWGQPIQKDPPEGAEQDPAFNQELAAPETEADVPGSPPPEGSPTVAEKTPETPMSVPNIPALDAAQQPQGSPSPVVHPLRPSPRKRKSLAAVELPSFPPLPKQTG